MTVDEFRTSSICSKCHSRLVKYRKDLRETVARNVDWRKTDQTIYWTETKMWPRTFASLLQERTSSPKRSPSRFQGDIEWPISDQTECVLPQHNINGFGSLRVLRWRGSGENNLSMFTQTRLMWRAGVTWRQMWLRTWPTASWQMRPPTSNPGARGCVRYWGRMNRAFWGRLDLVAREPLRKVIPLDPTQGYVIKGLSSGERACNFKTTKSWAKLTLFFSQ